ncbi:beta strand repeat-containing protein [Escherichia coli]|uniref:beta strand repeat-containing protein n=1 Tax=Escherichia coli TaxID=562 RepID=UPI0030CEC7E0
MKMIFTGKVSGEKTVLAAGARHTVKAQAGEQYGLIDEVTGLVPDGVEADRSGDDLILRKKEDDTEIRIEGFWEECQPGETQCTAVFNVVGENGQVTEAVLTQDGPVLENFTAGQSGTLSDDDRGGFIWLGGLAFGGGLAAMALAAGGGGGSKHRHENHEADTTAPSAPALTAGDNGSVSVELPDDANKGDTVEITFVNENGDGQKVTLEKGDNGWTSDNSALIPDSQGDTATIAPDTVKDNSEVTAVAKDPAGNESAPVTVTSKTDGVSDAPVLTIPEAADSVNAEELKDGVQAEVTLPAGTVEGAVITLTVTHPDQSTENVTHNVTGDEVTAGKVSMDIPEDAVVDGQNSVRVSLTQGSNPAKEGNTVEIVVDGQVPGDTNGDGVADTTPVVTIPEATGGVNAEELKDGIQAEVTVPAGSAEGDTVTLTVTKPDGKTETVGRELTAKEVEDGKANVTIPADKVATDGEYSVTAEITDPAGNTSGQGQAAEFAVDRVAPSAPALTAGDNGSVSVELPDDANKGDTVEITFVNENGDGQKVTLEKGDNGWTSDNSALIPDSQGDTATIAPDTVKDNSEVTAVAKDPAGNESAPVTVTSKTDGVSDAPVLTIPEAADSVNAEELKDGVQAEVTLPAGTVEGAVITLTVTHPDQSTENVTHNVTGDEVTAGKVSMDIPEDAVVDGQNSVRVSLTQGSNPAKEGNTVEIVVDGQVPGDTNGDGVADTTPVVTIPEATGGVNAEELKDGIQAEVTVPAGSAEGDTVTLTVTKPDGKTETVGRELTAKEVEDGKANVTIPADKVATDGEYSVTAEITDPAGNTSGQGQAAEFAVDRVAPSAPALTAGDNGSVSVELPDDANKGDTVEITFVNENGDGQKVTLEKGDNGWTSDNSALIPDSQGDTATIAPDTVKDNSEVTAVAKDPAGNESAPVTVTSKTDGVSDAPVLTIPEAADSVNAEELKDGVQAEVTLPAGTVEGAVITLTVTHPDQSTENVTHNVTGDEVTAGKVSMDIPEDAVVDGQNSVRVSLTQGSNPAKEGNTVEIVVDGQVPGDTNGDGVADTTPVVTIPEATGGVNAEELKDGIQAEVTVPAGSAEGDTVTLTVTKPDGKTETVGRELTAKEVEDGKANVTIPADKVATDGEYSVTAEITDPAGNTSGQGQAAEFAVDRVAPSAPALTAGDNGSVSVELPDDANKGDTVEITFVNENGDGQKVTLEKGDNGWTSDNSALIPDSQGDTATIAPDTVKDNSEVTAVAKDPAGNESAPVTVTSKTDGVSDAPVLTIPEAADSVNAEELKDGVQAEVTLPAGTVEGAVITLTVTHPDQSTENVTHNVTGDEVTAGKVSMDIPEDAVVDGQNSVRVSLTQGSNPAKEGNTVEIVVDGQVPGDTNGDGVADTTPVVTIPEATGGVNAEELKDGIQAEVTVPAGSAEGDTVTLTVTKPDGKTETVGRELTAKEVEDGKANVTIPADKVATDGEYSVTAEITDPAGNTSGQGQAAEFAVDRVAPSAPALTAGDNGSVSVELPDDANKGDTVEITFVNENGDGQKVTLEKGDNGWTSDNSALIPDSQGDTATIAPDTVKDNSEVTAVAKDPAGNESAPVTVTSKTDGVSDAPVLTIPEAADSVNAEELKDGVQAEVTLPAGTVEGAVITLTVTHPDQSTENVTHNVTGDEVTAGKVSMDIPEDAVVDGQNSVRVSLTQGSNPAKEGNTVEIVVDGQVPGDTNGDGVADTTPVVTIPEATGGVNAEELKDGIQAEVTVPAGSAEGDTVTLTVTKPDGKTETVGRELTAKEVEDGKANVTIPADKVATDGEYSVTAEITDPAGNTSGQGQAAEFAVDRVAPSAPALTAGDNGSVSVELPDDANKGDTVEITFVNENGDGQKVTLEKGDNGWTSDNSALIPDSQGDTATIAPDTVKDNSEVTAVAKDPAGNESAPVTVTSKTDVLPTVSISVETTSLSDDAAMTALASVNGHTENVPATMEDKLDTTGLVYTVSLSAVTSTAVTVKVTLKDGMGYADVSDYSVVDGAQYSGKISLYGDTGQVSYDGKSTVTVVIPAGSERVSFIVDPVLEANQDAFVAEGMERVVATITEASENVTVAADIVDNSGISATGVIYDGNAVALTNLDGDLTLKYALSTSKAPNDQGYTVGVTTEPYDPMLTTDYSDIVYVGYYQSGKETGTYSNLANSLDGGPDNSKADGNASISTVDLGKGDDIISIRGNLYTSTRVYGGEGKDVITVGGMNEAMRVLYTDSYIFAEAGDDTVVIERTSNQNSGQIYLGSGSDKYTQGDADNKNNTELTGTLDLGSGMKDASNMPEEYLSVYQDGTDTSLGNDTNIDAESDTNTVEIYGSVSGTISGGYGIDNITITKNLTGSVSTGDNTDTLTVNSVYGGATVNMGAGDDTVIVHGALYNATISMGDGDDTLDLTTASLGKSATTTSVRAGENDDVIKLGDISTLSTGKTEIDAGAGDDVIVLTKDYDSGKGLNQGYINGGDGSDTLVLSGNITVRLTSGKYLSEEGITNIEKIDMTTGKDLMPEDAPQTVKLSVSDVIGMNESTTLYISGDASDKVDLGSDDTKSLGGFTKQAQTTTSLALDGTEHTYTLYSSDSGAQVYIDDNIVNANGVI